MIEKFISGGQTGADQAALDVAVKYNIPYGGWIPKGRRTEAGPLPARYRMSLMPSAEYRDRTLKNIQDSHGTAVLYRNRLMGGSKLTRQLARTEGKPCMAVNLETHDPFETAVTLQSFRDEYQINVLNIAGPRASHDPDIYMDVKMVLEIFVYLLFLERRSPGRMRHRSWTMQRRIRIPFRGGGSGDVGSAFEINDSGRPAGSVGNSDPVFSWVDGLRFQLGLDAGNTALLEACRRDAALPYFTVEDAVMAVIKAVKTACEQACQLRIVP